jgi:Family of unknown function (DUF6159)
MGRIARGWSLAKQSLAVVRTDGSLAALVVLGAIASILIAAALFIPAAISWPNDRVLGGILIVGGVYLTTASGVFFGVALAAASADVLDGRAATVGRSVSVASGKLGPILGWALILTTVNIVLQAITERTGIIGAIVGRILGVAWALTTFLVIPIVALEGIGATDALKRSGKIFRERWGTQIVGQVSITGLFFICGVLPGMVLGGIGIASGSTGLAIVLVAIGAVVVIASMILAAAARAVFSVALYRFATGSGSFAPFSAGDLEQVVRQRRKLL